MKSKLALQIVMGLVSLVPIGGGIRGIIQAPKHMPLNFEAASAVTAEFRFLSAVWLVAGLVIIWIIPRVEKETGAFRVVGAAIILGGLSRIISLVTLGPFHDDSSLYIFMGLEIGLTPLLLIWQTYVAKAYKASLT